MGFSGALVPGITVYGYLMNPLVAHFGTDFLDRGFISVRLRRPVYEGDKVRVEGRLEVAEDGSEEAVVSAVNPAGEACGVARARMPEPTDETGDVPELLPLPQPKRPATPEELRREPRLGSFEGRYQARAGAGFAKQLGETHPVYREVAHSAWLLRQANYVVDANLDLGPWIHVSSDVQHLGRVHDGESFSTRARVQKLYEKNRHDYADLDVVIVTDRPVMRILHRAIYRLGS